MNSTAILIIACSLFSISWAKTLLRPVYEPNGERIGHAGNPMKANNNLNSNQMIQLHIQDQQARYNYEKIKRQEAQLVKPEQAKSAIDSYMKAYRDQHETYQKDQENRQLKNVHDFGKKVKQTSGQHRNKRVYEPKPDEMPKIQDRSLVVSSRSYDTSPFVPMVSYSPQYNIMQSKQDPYAFAVYSYQPQQYAPQNYGGTAYLKSLNSLIGKQPQEQLKGLSQLLGSEASQEYKLYDGELRNAHLNLKASTLDVPLGRYGFNPAVKDHTPITEDMTEVAKVVVIPTSQQHQLRLPVQQHTTEAPAVLTSASNYYKVEVGSKTISGSQPESHSYVHNAATHLPSYTSGHDNLESYASKYEFGYRVRDLHSGNDFGHRESSQGDTSSGAYHVLLPDGRVQQVVYNAGPAGFQAQVTYH